VEQPTVTVHPAAAGSRLADSETKRAPAAGQPDTSASRGIGSEVKKRKVKKPVERGKRPAPSSTPSPLPPAKKHRLRVPEIEE
jgi:hypothetical protein